MKGLRKGREAARLWATRKPGGVQQTIEVEELYEDGTESGAGTAVALIRRVWRWDEDGSHASTDELAWFFELHDHKIRSWRPSRTGPPRCTQRGSSDSWRVSRPYDGKVARQ